MEPSGATPRSDSVGTQVRRSSLPFDGRRVLAILLGVVAALVAILVAYVGSLRDRSALSSGPAVAAVPVVTPAEAALAILDDLSCEAALAAYRKQRHVDVSQPDITAGQYGSVLNGGSYLSRCKVPSSMAVNICAAVQNGRAVGVTVTTRPADEAKATCVASAVRGLSFPSHPQLDVARTKFEAQ